MNEQQADIREPLDALLELLQEHAEQRCQQIREEAEQQARELVRGAYREARQHVHKGIEEERWHANRRIEAARAQLETRNRQHYRDAVSHTLKRGWHRLERALAMRWRSADTRLLWVGSLVGRGLESLPQAAWRIEHPSDWSTPELGEWKPRIEARSGAPCVFVVDEDLSAGLRICAGGACLDGTLHGLMANREEIEAQLLAHLEEAQQ
ncbi:MAG TPA: hypothetical protein VKA76_16705 [Gammaproteobacteria bacterium]|nr:hypothetical protein [Gammaproteobacteria bacterium]